MNATRLLVPEEPIEIRDRARATLEDSPEAGTKLIEDAAFIADYFWEEWGEDLEGAGMGYGRFLAIARGYSGETRLWVVGERPWEHFAAGLAGRVRRRLGSAGHAGESALATTGVSR